ncbi:MAG TPA: hypothetical protein VMM80_03470 [Bacteroidota bacterium]|nr:hypothetical protein [Bacteroidota bacterium]
MDTRRYAWLIPLLFLQPATAAAGAGDREQFVVVNIIPGEQYRPIFEEIARLYPDSASRRIRVGIGAIFSYLNQARERTRGDLRAFLSLSGEFDIPVVVQLDGEQWWDGRPDLWNWWDPSRPGYDTSNRQNVEWSGWSPDSALKIAWRNWGKQLRVLPPPNLMSHRYRAACHAEMRALIPDVLAWWSSLPAAKKGLFIGLKLGWESSIGVNAFTIPGGNSLLARPESEDPQITIRGELVPDRGLVTIGYAAVSAAGLAGGGALREADLAEVVRRHLDDICSLAARLGVPRERMFTHVGGWKEGELLYDAALNRYSCPGWSFYRHAADPSKDTGVMRVLSRSDAPYWGAVEWLLEGSRTLPEWTAALRTTLAIPRCRYLNIYNWSGIRTNPAAVGAIRDVVISP